MLKQDVLLDGVGVVRAPAGGPGRPVKDPVAADARKLAIAALGPGACKARI
jgi:hypothetical protein